MAEQKPASNLRKDVVHKKEIDSPLPSINFFRSCIEQGVYLTDKDFWYKPIPDPIKFKQVFNDYLPALEQEQQEREAILAVPSDFDWGNSTQKAVRDSIRIIFKSGLIDRETLVHTAKFAGPDNVVIQHGRDHSNMNMLRYFQYLVESKGITDLPLPIPESKAVRNEHIALEMGTGVVLSNAKRLFDAAYHVQIPMIPEQAIAIALTEISAHEYTHAMEHALAAEGVDTFSRAKEAKLTTSPWDKSIHAEHFASGVQAIVIRSYLRELGYSNEQITKLYATLQENSQKKVEAVKAFIQLLREKGMSDEEIEVLEIEFNRNAKDILGKEVEKYLPDMQKVLAYSDTPYSEETIRALVKKN